MGPAGAVRHRASRGSGSPAVAEEVSNEVFLQLMGASSHFDETRGSLESFLFGIARNLIRVVRRQGPVAEAVDRPFHHDILGELIGNESIAALHWRAAPALHRSR